MIESGADLERQYSKAFRAAGGNPDICEGVLWLRQAVDIDPELTADEIFTRMGRKIIGGTANHGWLIGILAHLWDDLSEAQRLRIIEIMGPHISKCLLSKQFSHIRFTDAERLRLIDYMKRAKCPGAVRRLGG